jgi:transcription termination factor Rho
MNAIESGLKVDTPYIVMMAQAFLEKNKDKVILMDSVIRSQEQNEALEPLF